MSKVSSGDSKNTLYCSFCGKSQHEVRKLIAGPNAYLGGIEFAVGNALTRRRA